jgi:hypothetical protein
MPEWYGGGDEREAMLADIEGDYASARECAARTQALGEKLRGEFLEHAFSHGEESIISGPWLRALLTS